MFPSFILFRMFSLWRDSHTGLIITMSGDISAILLIRAFRLLTSSKLSGLTSFPSGWYVVTNLHLKVTAVLCGPREVGKSPLVEATAARFARMYQEKDEFYIVTSTPDSLRLLADEDLLVEGVPIIFEELEGKDNKSHARPLTANAMKHLCGVKDGGVMSARYRDFALNRKQPRMITTNSDPAQWLNDITMEGRDQDALKKRIVFFNICEPLITDASNGDLNTDLQAFVDEGHARLARKLSSPM